MPFSSRDLIDQARDSVPEVDAGELAHALEQDPLHAVIDVREQEEVAQGLIASAIHIPRGYLELRVETVLPDRDRPVTLYCAVGVRSLLAANTLRAMGYTNVRSLRGASTRGRIRACRSRLPAHCQRSSASAIAATSSSTRLARRARRSCWTPGFW